MAYNTNNVLINNWVDDRFENDFQFNFFLKKRKRNELLLQRSRTMLRNLLMEKTPTLSGTYVQLGFGVQVVAADIPGYGSYVKHANFEITNSAPQGVFNKIPTYKGHLLIEMKTKSGELRNELALSCTINEKEIDYMQNIQEKCIVTFSPLTTPCSRNTFTVLRANDQKVCGEKLKYGEDFILRAENYANPEASSLYVCHPTKSMPPFPDRPPLRLSAILDRSCRWRAVPLLPQDRLEREGTLKYGSIPKSHQTESYYCLPRSFVYLLNYNKQPAEIFTKLGEKLLIINCAAHKNLCVANQNWIRTFFGPAGVGELVTRSESGSNMRTTLVLNSAKNVLGSLGFNCKGNTTFTTSSTCSPKLQRPFKKQQYLTGDLLLGKYRKMTENLNSPTVLSSSTTTITFGANFSLLAPHVGDSNKDDPEKNSTKGLLLGGCLTTEAIEHTQELCEGCRLVGIADLRSVECTTFVIASTDSCNREGEPLNYDQEFFLVNAKSLKTKPLYVRYDPDPIPGVSSKYPLYLSERPSRNARWRVLPVKSPERTRYEMQGHPVPVNQDVVINHSSTNLNMGFSDYWSLGFYEKIRAPIVKTLLDKYGCEKPENIWQMRTAVPNFG